MKIVEVRYLIDVGDFRQSREWKKVYSQVADAIQAVEWPPGSGSFTLYPSYLQTKFATSIK